LACAVVFTEEVAASSAIEQFIRGSLGLACGLALDKKIFSADSEVIDTSPAGILQTAPIAATAGGGEAALAKDIANLVGALAAAGGGLDPVIVASPAQAAALKVWAGPQFDYPILSSAALAVGTVAMVEASSFVSGFRGTPEIDASRGGVVQMESMTPLQI